MHPEVKILNFTGVYLLHAKLQRLYSLHKLFARSLVELVTLPSNLCRLLCLKNTPSATQFF